MANTVTVFLRGGLGNQMFQYALGLQLAKKNGARLVLDTTYLGDRTPRKNFTYRNFDLDIFALDPKLTFLSRAQKILPIPLLWLGADMAFVKTKEVLGMQKTVRERNDRFDPAVIDARGNIFLYGRWQSEKYFADSADDIHAAFQFRHPMQGEAAQIAKKIRACNAVSLHVRRGDYAAFKNVVALMGNTNLGYYATAAKYIAEHARARANGGESARGLHFFIFSDDIEWCKKNLTLAFPATYVSAESEGPKASWHMELMSLCKHNIITNSTFSWWGAWLNANPQKIVVAPRKWYADGRGGEEDIVPKGWIKI